MKGTLPEETLGPDIGEEAAGTPQSGAKTWQACDEVHVIVINPVRTFEALHLF